MTGDDDAKTSFMHLKVGCFVRAVWLVIMPGKDILAAVYRNPGEDWWAGYRWRHDRDRKVFNSDDEKSFYRIHAKQEWTDSDVEAVVNALDETMHLTVARVAHLDHAPLGTVRRFDIRGDTEKLWAELMLEPSAHILDMFGGDMKRGGRT